MSATPGNAPSQRKVAGQFKAREALEKLEQAQVILGEAAADLCSLQGVYAQYVSVGKLYDRVKATWYSLDARVGRAVLDHEPKLECRCGCAAIATAEGKVQA